MPRDNCNVGYNSGVHVAAEPFPVEIVNPEPDFCTASNILASLALDVSICAAIWQWWSNGARVKLDFSVYGSELIPEGDRNYPKASLIVTAKNAGRTETTVTDPIIHTGNLPRLIWTSMWLGSWRHTGHGAGQHFPVEDIAEVEISLTQIMGFTPAVYQPVKNLKIEVVTANKEINKKLPKDVARVVQGWVDQCRKHEGTNSGN